MSYHTGTALDMSQVKGAILAAATANSWTIMRDNGPNFALRSPAGNNWAFRIAQGADDAKLGGVPTNPSETAYIPLNGGIYVYTPTSLDSSMPVWQQPGASGDRPNTGGWFNMGRAGPYVRYHVFGGPEYIHAVVEVQNKVFAHLHIGNLDKPGMSYVGGQYTQLSSYQRTLYEGYMRLESKYTCPWGTEGDQVPINGGTLADNYTSQRNLVKAANLPDRPGLWAWGTRDTCAIGRGGTSYHFDQGLVRASANDMTGDTLIVPVRPFVSVGQRRLVPLGVAPDVGVCDMRFIAPGESVFYGQEEWMVFPIIRYDNLRWVTVNGATSYHGYIGSVYGWAYKVNR